MPPEYFRSCVRRSTDKNVTKRSLKNFADEWDFIKLLAGGKSGALVVSIRHKSNPRRKKILKIYIGAHYDSDKKRFTKSAPYREIISYCLLGASASPHFLKVCESGIMVPSKWTSRSGWQIVAELLSEQKSAYIVMDYFSAGKSLMDTNLDALSAGDLSKILKLTIQARNDMKSILGKKSLHLDLHPGNILVATRAIPNKPKKRKVTNVVLMDFDYVSSSSLDHTKQIADAQSISLSTKRRIKKSSSFRIAHTSGVQWAAKWIGYPRALRNAFDALADSEIRDFDTVQIEFMRLVFETYLTIR